VEKRTHGHMGDREICFFCSHYRVKNNNYTTVICRGIMLGGQYKCILAEGAKALSVTLSGGVLFAS